MLTVKKKTCHPEKLLLLIYRQSTINRCNRDSLGNLQRPGVGLLRSNRLRGTELQRRRIEVRVPAGLDKE